MLSLSLGSIREVPLVVSTRSLQHGVSIFDSPNIFGCPEISDFTNIFGCPNIFEYPHIFD